MAKILWIAEVGTLDSQQHIIDELIENNHQVVIQHDGNYPKFKTKEYLDQHNKEHYDYAVYTIHVGNPNATEFVRSLNCQRKFVIAHDVFGDVVEGAHPAWRNEKLIVFTKKHEQYAHNLGNKNTVQAKWYKLDMKMDIIKEDPNLFNNAVIIDSEVFDNTAVFPYKNLFNKVYLKRWSKLNTVWENNRIVNRVEPSDLRKYGVDDAPEYLIGMPGFLNSAKLAKFWFVRESSLIVEAMMIGCIPVLYGAPKNEFKDTPYIIQEKPVNDIVSDVVVNIRLNDTVCQPYPMKAVTCSNLEHKIKKLSTDKKVFSDTLALLSKEWFFDIPISQLPTVEDILLDHIGRK